MLCLPPFQTFKKLDVSFDLLICVGGDGTTLRAITYVKDLNIPIVGINTGRLGFLATIKKDAIVGALDQIFEGKYRISKRSVLCVTTNKKEANFDLDFALNEIAISRKNTTTHNNTCTSKRTSRKRMAICTTI